MNRSRCNAVKKEVYRRAIKQLNTGLNRQVAHTRIRSCKISRYNRILLMSNNIKAMTTVQRVKMFLDIPK